jgi:hypothetical protein
VLIDFWVAKVASGVVMLAHNLMSAFRQAVIRQQSHPKLSTLNPNVLATLAYWGVDEDETKPTLNLALTRKLGPWF